MAKLSKAVPDLFKQIRELDKRDNVDEQIVTFKQNCKKCVITDENLVRKHIVRIDKTGHQSVMMTSCGSYGWALSQLRFLDLSAEEDIESVTLCVHSIVMSKIDHHMYKSLTKLYNANMYTLREVEGVIPFHILSGDRYITGDHNLDLHVMFNFKTLKNVLFNLEVTYKKVIVGDISPSHMILPFHLNSTLIKECCIDLNQPDSGTDINFALTVENRTMYLIVKYDNARFMHNICIKKDDTLLLYDPKCHEYGDSCLLLPFTPTIDDYRYGVDLAANAYFNTRVSRVDKSRTATLRIYAQTHGYLMDTDDTFICISM